MISEFKRKANEKMEENKFKILIVEDSHEDFEILSTALSRVGVDALIHRCEDGEEAVDYLHRCCESVSKKSPGMPCLIFLDLNLPILDGREVLQEIKTHAELKSVPVVILSTSNYLKDIDKCYSLGANSYVQKPSDFSGFIALAKSVKHYWMGMVQTPEICNIRI